MTGVEKGGEKFLHYAGRLVRGRTRGTASACSGRNDRWKQVLAMSASNQIAKPTKRFLRCAGRVVRGRTRGKGVGLLRSRRRRAGGMTVGSKVLAMSASGQIASQPVGGGEIQMRMVPSKTRTAAPLQRGTSFFPVCETSTSIWLGLPISTPCCMYSVCAGANLPFCTR
jgi:hypothetical protein